MGPLPLVTQTSTLTAIPAGTQFAIPAVRAAGTRARAGGTVLLAGGPLLGGP